MDDPAPVVSQLEEKNALALAIVPVSGKNKFNIIQRSYHQYVCIFSHHIYLFLPVEQPVSTTDFTNGNSSGWELALVTAPSSNEVAAANSKLVNK